MESIIKYKYSINTIDQKNKKQFTEWNTKKSLKYMWCY